MNYIAQFVVNRFVNEPKNERKKVCDKNMIFNYETLREEMFCVFERKRNFYHKLPLSRCRQLNLINFLSFEN